MGNPKIEFNTLPMLATMDFQDRLLVFLKWMNVGKPLTAKTVSSKVQDQNIFLRVVLSSSSQSLDAKLLIKDISAGWALHIQRTVLIIDMSYGTDRYGCGSTACTACEHPNDQNSLAVGVHASISCWDSWLRPSSLIGAKPFPKYSLPETLASTSDIFILRFPRKGKDLGEILLPSF